MSLNEQVAREVMGWPENKDICRWRPTEDIEQAFWVIDEVLSWGWDSPVWFEMTVDGQRPRVQLLCAFGFIAEETGESLPETICRVALMAWRKGEAKRRSEDV